MQDGYESQYRVHPGLVAEQNDHLVHGPGDALQAHGEPVPAENGEDQPQLLRGEFIADILGGNKIVLVGSLIQEQMTRGNNWPFAAALAVVLMILTTLMIVLYRKLTNVKELEGIG